MKVSILQSMYYGITCMIGLLCFEIFFQIWATPSNPQMYSAFSLSYKVLHKTLQKVVETIIKYFEWNSWDNTDV